MSYISIATVTDQVWLHETIKNNKNKYKIN
jgi:hypothetical protein